MRIALRIPAVTILLVDPGNAIAGHTDLNV